MKMTYILRWKGGNRYVTAGTREVNAIAKSESIIRKSDVEIVYQNGEVWKVIRYEGEKDGGHEDEGKTDEGPREGTGSAAGTTEGPHEMDDHPSGLDEDRNTGDIGEGTDDESKTHDERVDREDHVERIGGNEALSDYMTVQEVADLTGFTTSGIRKVITNGELKAAKIGKQYVIQRNEFNDFISKRRERKSKRRVMCT